jgi:DNA-directed RNA polymerase subunit RPC12/RpoP
MPIRFRCAYCNQLLGIARRKAGTVVRCPTCAGQVIVPPPDADLTEKPVEASDPFVFESSDFDDLLKPEEGRAGPPGKKAPSSTETPVAVPPEENPPSGAWGTHAEPPYDIERLNPTPTAVPIEPVARPAGLVLTPAKLTLAVVIVIVVCALTFIAGLIIGSRLHAAGAGKESGRSRRPAATCTATPTGPGAGAGQRAG